MRKNHQPYWLFYLQQKVRKHYTSKIIVPQFDSVGEGLTILKPRTLKLFGKNIHAGNHLHIISDHQKPVALSCWHSKQNSGNIIIGNHVLISPGVSIASASHIYIGDNCMIAAECYISDCDWHGTYNRIRPFRCTADIRLEDNVWLGYRSIIGKGVTIGENSIVAAGAVVISDVAENTIVGGNPAKVIATLNPERRMLKRELLFPPDINEQHHSNTLDYYAMSDNTLWQWLKSKIAPNRLD